MAKIPKKSVAVIVVALALAGATFLAQKYFPALRAAFLKPPQDITTLLPEAPSPGGGEPSDIPLQLPKGFSISVFAKNLPGARVMTFDQFGNMWVSRTSEGAVTLLEIDRDTGNVRDQGDIFVGLKNPHGLAFDPDHPLLLYIAEETSIRRVGTYSEDPGADVLALPPSGGGHFTRTIGFGPDKKLYVSVGSSCNVCHESDDRRAAIVQYDPATHQSRVFARGLRNAVFFTWDAMQRMWATENGRDWLGDNAPPDELNIIEDGGNYGWPTCYGKNIHDTDFDKNTYIRNPCMEPFEKPAAIDIPAHSAPLGLAFIPDSEPWPAEYRGNLLVAYHGSWNRSTPTGYKVVRFKFDTNGTYQGSEDVITGWLTSSGALGRPVDIVAGPDGAIYISDDKAGVIYRLSRTAP